MGAYLRKPPLQRKHAAEKGLLCMEVGWKLIRDVIQMQRRKNSYCLFGYLIDILGKEGLFSEKWK